MVVDKGYGWESMEIADAREHRQATTIRISPRNPGVLEFTVDEGCWPRFTRDTVRELIPHLQAFVDTGSLVIRETK